MIIRGAPGFRRHIRKKKLFVSVAPILSTSALSLLQTSRAEAEECLSALLRTSACHSDLIQASSFSVFFSIKPIKLSAVL